MNTPRLKSIRAAKWYHILPVKAGQMLEIHETVGEEGNLRTWKFKGLVIKVKKPNHIDGTFTIRGKAAGQTIEKIYPLSFSKFEKVLVVDNYKVRRSKLYYIRDKVGKDAKFKSIATAQDKGVDLLELATEEAKKIQEAAAPVVESIDDVAPETTDTPQDAPETTENTDTVESDTSAQDEAPAVDTPPSEPDDLTKIEWIGPKINELLHTAGISTYAALGDTDADTIKWILESAEGNFATHDPTTRPQQSKMAAEWKWDELKTLQDELDGGKPAA